MSLEVFPEQGELRMLPLHLITERLSVRRLSPAGLERLTESMQREGFLENFPLTVIALADGTFQLIDGHHRYEAALALSLSAVPCVIKRNLSEQERYRLAWQSNRVAETVVPSTLVTYAEFIWQRSAEYTQQEIADMLGWSRGAVSNYALLQKLDRRAWDIIATTFEPAVAGGEEPAVVATATPVAFTENLLRDLLPLSAQQQEELVRALASGTIKKGRLTELARAYRGRNEMEAQALQRLGDLGEAFRVTLSKELSSGAYDADWKDPAHPKLEKLIAGLREEWERAHRLHLLHGEFSDVAATLPDGCIDLILTDPPYNIAREQVFELQGRSAISQNFGEWDKSSEEDFLARFATWTRQWARLLRPQGSGYVFTSDRHLSHLRAALTEAGLHVKATIVWHKTNPAPQVVQTNFNSSVEYLLFFTKGEGGHTFNWQGEEEMHNFIETPVCGGSERLVDGRGKTLHPTQKPEHLFRHFLTISSHRGETVFDGFAGTGTCGKVAKDLGRRFIGIEQDRTYFEAMQRRLAE